LLRQRDSSHKIDWVQAEVIHWLQPGRQPQNLDIRLETQQLIRGRAIRAARDQSSPL